MAFNIRQKLFDDREEFLEEARREAIAKAKEKAEALAKEAGVKLGKIISINESGGASPAPYPEFARVDSFAGLGGGAPAPDIEAGSSDISVTVSLTYEVL